MTINLVTGIVLLVVSVLGGEFIYKWATYHLDQSRVQFFFKVNWLLLIPQMLIISTGVVEMTTLAGDCRSASAEAVVWILELVSCMFFLVEGHLCKEKPYKDNNIFIPSEGLCQTWYYYLAGGYMVAIPILTLLTSSLDLHLSVFSVVVMYINYLFVVFTYLIKPLSRSL